MKDQQKENPPFVIIIGFYILNKKKKSFTYRVITGVD